ncbi:hypothetical protein ANCCEY_14422 [Ancylostoma ceylanicum]|uniref:Uncharacterized protein n=2 Tax=Ancylostoma ceylanicum TaxID=53326 RepID=A0A0D6LFP8_9BILA|nr:hypothetical protein ANCCEY_14422 [Ancylostoma ceylanicum]EYC35793.1 hypothetical protein Y032_0982g3282 [Ancylostoma ceylanicum]
MAMFIAAKLAKFVRNQMRIKFDSILFFSKLQIALFWIYSKKGLKTFVKNRVQFIHNTVNDLRTNNTKVKFHFVITNDNPADYATRGLTATDCAHHTWWNGPSSVLTPEEQWPNRNMDFSDLTFDDEEEANSEFKTPTVCKGSFTSVIPYRRINKYNKLVKIVGIVLKFPRKRVYDRISREGKIRLDVTLQLNRIEPSRNTTLDDVQQAEHFITRHHYKENVSELNRYTQDRNLKLFSDKDGIFRAITRMKNSRLQHDAKNPVLLLPKHPLSQMILEKHHRKLRHGGVPHAIVPVRGKYIMLKPRQIAESVLR